MYIYKIYTKDERIGMAYLSKDVRKHGLITFMSIGNRFIDKYIEKSINK